MATSEAAFVLHQWDWSETSLILDLFTRGHGRVAVVAKGAKRPYSQLRPVLLSFQRLQVQLGRSRHPPGGADEGSDIQLLRGADYAGGGAVLPPARMMAGFYCNELLLKLLARHDPHERLFDAYADTLATLCGLHDDAPPEDEAAALRAFELLLLRETGVLPELDRATLTQQPVSPDARYALQAEAGLVGADDAAALPGGLCLALQAALRAGDLPALRQAACTAPAALRVQLRGLLHYHLGSPRLRTRELMLDVRRLSDRAPA